MKAWSSSLLAVALALPAEPAPNPLGLPSLTAPAGKLALPPARQAPRIELGYQAPAGTAGRASLGAKGGISEGKPLEMMVWGSGGAVAGSLAGPVGAAVGGAVGTLTGLLISAFVVPHQGP